MSDALKDFRNLKGYSLVNGDKLNRAVFGSEGPEGKLQGGVGEEASALEVLAAYDKLGGLILKGKAKVKTGSFWDFDAKKARKAPKVVLEFRNLKGKKIELGEDEEVPVDVQAAEKLREEEAEEAAVAAAKKKGKTAKGKSKAKKPAEEEGETEEVEGGEDDVEEVDEDSEASEDVE